MVKLDKSRKHFEEAIDRVGDHIQIDKDHIINAEIRFKHFQTATLTVTYRLTDEALQALLDASTRKQEDS